MVVLVVCVVLPVAGVGAGAEAPGVSIWPVTLCASITETASVRLRIIAAQIWRKVFTFGASLER